MRTDYEERKQRKIDRAKELAEKRQSEADASFGAARKIGSMIPFGQPILVGHHSEGHHRRDAERIHTNMRKGVENEKKANFHAERAERLENDRTISSDDPNALNRLEEKLQKLIAKQEFMKAENKKTPGKFESFRLSNNNANIRRIKQRIEQLMRIDAMESTDEVINGIRIFRNVPGNRMQLFFPDKPSDEIRSILKANGFRWSPLEGAWQRQLGDGVTELTKRLINSFVEGK